MEKRLEETNSRPSIVSVKPPWPRTVYYAIVPNCLVHVEMRKVGVGNSGWHFALSKDSSLTSFRCNRFNNIFENACAVMKYRSEMLQFFQEFCTTSSLKIRSAVADLQDDTLMQLVSVLAFFSILLTTPYWQFMQSNKPYSAFPPVVLRTQTFLQHWIDADTSKKPSDINVDFNSNQLSAGDKDLISTVLSDIDVSAVSTVATHILGVTKSQLSDFLEGGKYFSPSEEILSILSHCPLTNLVREHAFGDLDFDFNKSRRSSLHHRSTLQMMKRNGTVEWCDSQDQERQTSLFA